MRPILERKSQRTISLPFVLSVICIILSLGIGLFITKEELSYKGNTVNLDKQVLIDSALIVPRFSHLPGFHKKEFYLNIEVPDSSSNIYFTTDGTTPSEDSELYTKPILISNRENFPNINSEIPTSPVWRRPLYQVFKGTTVKAITIKDNRKSIESSTTLFVHPKGRSRYSLPVINLTINNEDFFGYKKGIYVMGATRDDKDFYIRNQINVNPKWYRLPANYIRRGLRWERNVKLDYFEPYINKGFSEKAGIRIHGNASRGFAQKSLRILFREKYGNQFLNYNIFEQKPYLPLPSILLKGFGQDQTKALFRDNLMQALLAEGNFNLIKQQNKVIVLFINGEYWGLFNIQERIDAENLSLKYNIPIDSLTILGNEEIPEHGSVLDRKDYTNIETYIKANDLSISNNYNYVKSKIDVDNLIDYLIANMYASNTDWPDTNLKLWRYKGKTTIPNSFKDGRWRWILIDLDLGFGGKGTVSENMLNHVLTSQTFGPIFRSLIRSSEFQKQFIKRFEYHLNNSFKVNNVLSEINKFEKMFEPEISEHIRRWRTIESYQDWRSEVETIKNFAKRRSAFQFKELVYFMKQSKLEKSSNIN